MMKILMLLLFPLLWGLAKSQQQDLDFRPDQFHIQTDEGGNRFFKYQTHGGQLRKETRLEDGTVVGSYGWIDARNTLRLWDYIADKKGYRITNIRKYLLGEGGKILHSSESKKKTRRKNSRPETKNVVKKAETKQPEQQLDTSRLLRRNGLAVAPIFDINPEANEIEPEVVRPSVVKDNRKVKKARGRRNFFVRRRDDNFISRRAGGRGLGNPRFIPADNVRRRGRVLVVRRRRLPDAVLDRREGADVNYQTDKAYHKERIFKGKRIGEYGYIDPLGVRRVVTYKTDQLNGLSKAKENDYVGPQTYFQAV